MKEYISSVCSWPSTGLSSCGGLASGGLAELVGASGSL